MMLLQFKCQKLDREAQKLNRIADAVRQTELTKPMMGNLLSNKLPALPKLETKKDWPHFWMVTGWLIETERKIKWNLTSDVKNMTES